MEDTSEHISLGVYLDFTPELGPDILSHETIAHQKDDLAGKLSPESRRQLFCGVDSREEVPYICLDEDERVSDSAGVTFDYGWMHYPSSYDHSRYNSTARGIEGLSQRVHPVAREQQLVYYLPPEALADVWANITTTIQEPGFQQFRDVTILLQAKNLKVLTKDITWEKMMSRFEQYWTSAIDNSHTTTDLYFDVGKETCPQQPSQVVPWSQLAAGIIDNLPQEQAETLLYRRCCLESYAFQVGNRYTDDKGTQKQVFYPFSMLQDTGSLTIETGKRSPRRAAGLLYSQFYSRHNKSGKYQAPFFTIALDCLGNDLFYAF
ncbi:hypothetical protein ACKAV7_008444 [Fusarium commune]